VQIILGLEAIDKAVVLCGEKEGGDEGWNSLTSSALAILLYCRRFPPRQTPAGFIVFIFLSMTFGIYFTLLSISLARDPSKGLVEFGDSQSRVGD